jgi:hypothetical protein
MFTNLDFIHQRIYYGFLIENNHQEYSVLLVAVAAKLPCGLFINKTSGHKVNPNLSITNSSNIRDMIEKVLGYALYTTVEQYGCQDLSIALNQ